MSPVSSETSLGGPQTTSGNKESKLVFELHPDLARDGIYVGSFSLCQLLLINDSAYPWFVLVPQRENIRDTIDLTKTDFDALWAESHVLSVAIMKIFGGEKLNVAALGNITPQLHLHHVVRFTADPAWPGPIWGVQPLSAYPDARVEEIRSQLNAAQMPGFVSG